jgi:hypothetical protein
MSRTFDTREASGGDRLEHRTRTACGHIVPVGLGLFTGCAAGDTEAAVVLEGTD